MGSPANIMISDQAFEICERLEIEKYFSNAIEAYRCAILVAIAQNLEVNKNIKLVNNKWDTPAVFNNAKQNVTQVMQLLGYQKDEIVNEGIYLAEAGLEFLNSKLQKNLSLYPYLLGIK